MQSFEGQIVTGDVPAVAVHVEIEHTVMHPCCLVTVIIGGEAEHTRLDVMLPQLRGDDRVVVPEDERVVTHLILCDAELGSGIIL